MEAFAEILLSLIGIYAATGATVAVLLHVRGLHRIDPGVEHTSVFFRVLITPGLIALWPWMLAKWRKIASGQPAQGDPTLPVTPRRIRAIHGLTFQFLAVAIPVCLAVALLARREEPRVPTPISGLPQARAPLPDVESSSDQLFPGFSISVVLRRAGGDRQIELNVREELPLASPLLYWMPTPRTKPGATSVYLGALGGAGVYRFAVPSNIKPGDGHFVILSLVQGIALNKDLREGGA